MLIVGGAFLSAPMTTRSNINRGPDAAPDRAEDGAPTMARSEPTRAESVGGASRPDNAGAGPGRADLKVRAYGNAPAQFWDVRGGKGDWV